MLASGCGIVPIEHPPPSVTIENPFEFDVVRVHGGGSASWQDSLESSFLGVIPAGGERSIGSRTTGGTDRHCASEAAMIHFLRAAHSDVDLDDGEIADLGLTPGGFELVFTLGPGYCFGSANGSTYVIGDPFDSVADPAE